jgi:hypothetical protein
VFLHTVGSAGHVPVRPGRETSMNYFSCSGKPDTGSIKIMLGHVTPHLVFCILWDLWVTQCILECIDRETSMHYFSCSVGPGAVSIKSVQGHVTQTAVFASDRIYGSRSAFRCIPGVKRHCTIFCAQLGPVRFP